MKKVLLALVAIAMVIGFAGCDWFGGDKSPYFPLAEGNKWEYEATTTIAMDYPEGQYMPNDTTWTTTSTTVTEVLSKTNLTGEEDLEVWEVKTTTTLSSPDTTYEDTSYVRVKGDSVYTYVYLDSAATSVFPADPKKDDTWKQETVTYTVVADNETANDYTGCLKIEMKPDDTSGFDTYESFQYWAKNVGSVLSTMNMVAKTAMGADTLVTTTTSESKLTNFTK